MKLRLSAEPRKQQEDSDGNKEDASKCRISDDKQEKPKKKLSKLTVWTIKIVIITFCLSAVFSYLSQITTEHAPTVVACMLLCLLIVINILFDAIGVAAAACDLAPLLSMSARKVKGAKEAVALVKNAERVSNICCDVVGDICCIVSGACTVAIVIKIVTQFGISAWETWVTIALSSLVAAITIGGKAICKEIAIKNSKDMIMLCARVIHVFTGRKEQMKKSKDKK